ncbi:MAG: hypothetical protein KJ653_04910 [Candidatus Thermoplasmatota archaeon]|nr:hypothetical protein [Candidatus Thermoplasmatota archaeon]
MKGMVSHGICILLLGVASCALIVSSLTVSIRSNDVSVIPESDVQADTSGITVTIFELSEGVSQYNFTLSQLVSTGGSFRTPALYNETYTVSSDGNNITIGCCHFPPFNRTGVSTGNNIVAVRMNGVSGHPSGLWASVVVSYSLGYGGIAESRFNALGPADQLGPYDDYLSTFMGDFTSEIVLGFAEATPAITATLDFDPDTVNLASKGKWVVAYIELPDGYNVGDVVVASLVLNDAVPADLSHKATVGDADRDGVPDLMVKFSREALQQHLVVGPDQRVVVSGALSNGTMFASCDMIKVIDGGAKG